MLGNSRSKNGVASLAHAEHPPLQSRQGKDVDGRNKAGHDDTEGACMKSAEPRRPSERSIPGSLPK